MFAPILVFTYNRVNSFKRTIESLKAADLAGSSPLIIVSDGAKCEKSKVQVDQIREFCLGITGFKTVELVFRDTNWGIEKSFREAQATCLNNYGKMIMMEDDNLIHQKGLTFLNQALDFYEFDPKVFSISGYSIPQIFDISEDFYFLPWYVPWVFATWRDKFLAFDWEKKYFGHNVTEKKNITKFKQYGEFFYESAWLDYYGFSNAEDARVNMHLFYHNMVTVCPVKSFVKNIGNDGQGVNAGNTNKFDTNINFESKDSFEFKNFIELDEKVLSTQKSFLDRTLKNTIYIRRAYYIISFYFPKFRSFIHYLKLFLKGN